jgi:hypothetical protein
LAGNFDKSSFDLKRRAKNIRLRGRIEPMIFAIALMLCSAQDPNFVAYRYAEHIAICRRNVDQEEKLAVAKRYHITNIRSVEIDHIIPLCAGGSNAIENLQAEPWSLARRKDVLEHRVCSAIKAGKMTQNQAIIAMRAFQ